MAHDIGNMIAACCSFGIAYADRLLTDVSATHFAQFARPGGQLVESNHPAFIFGHLSLYGASIVENLGGDLAAVGPPENYPSLFSKQAVCQDDPDGNIYPAMDEIVACFYTGHRAAVAILRDTDDETFLKESPVEGRLRELFPTMGALLAFYVGGHMMTHLGQMSAWRRMMGMGAC
jgi:hypothetical protein